MIQKGTVPFCIILVFEADKAVADSECNALNYSVIAQLVLDALLIALNGI